MGVKQDVDTTRLAGSSSLNTTVSDQPIIFDLVLCTRFDCTGKHKPLCSWEVNTGKSQNTVGMGTNCAPPYPRALPGHGVYSIHEEKNRAAIIFTRFRRSSLQKQINH
jgi:hypothetical protein